MKILNFFILLLLLLGLTSCSIFEPTVRVVEKPVIVEKIVYVDKIVTVEKLVYPEIVFPEPLTINQLLLTEDNNLFVKLGDKYTTALKLQPFFTIDNNKKKNSCLLTSDFDKLTIYTYAYYLYVLDIHKFMEVYKEFINKYNDSRTKLNNESKK